MRRHQTALITLTLAGTFSVPHLVALVGSDPTYIKRAGGRFESLRGVGGVRADCLG